MRNIKKNCGKEGEKMKVRKDKTERGKDHKKR